MSDLTQRQFAYDVFLSHSRSDKPRVLRLADRLRSGGLRVWVDESSIKVGEEIPLAIQKGLLSSRRIVACLSGEYLKSEWGQAEIQTILYSDPNNASQRFIPVLLDDCELPPWFQRFKYLDYRQESEEAIAELRSACSQTSEEIGFVQPLHVAEDRFLQLLLSRFSLRRWHGRNGAELRLHFTEDTPAIWNSQGKRYILDKLDEARRKNYQKELDEFLLEGNGDTYVFDASDFWFRYASAGTLPVITFVDDESPRQYYCLFYRDVYPIGWNIANGGCDNRTELLNPEITMARELREELLIADFPNATRYVFAGDTEDLTDYPGHAAAIALWRKEHPDLDLAMLTTENVSVEWQPGPDSLCIRFGDKPAILRDGFFLNINGEDFGIEVDRVATIRLPRRVILFDGELEGSYLVNSPVGLFEVEEFNRRFLSGALEFRPDGFYFDARYHANGADIDSALKRFQGHVTKFRNREETEELQASIDAGTQFGLCPVTARIIQRHLHGRA